MKRLFTIMEMQDTQNKFSRDARGDIPKGEELIVGQTCQSIENSKAERRAVRPKNIASSSSDCFFGKGMVGSLLTDDLIDLLAFMVIEVERSTETTCS